MQPSRRLQTTKFSSKHPRFSKDSEISNIHSDNLLPNISSDEEEEEFYPSEEMQSTDLHLISKMLSISKCTILKSGKRLTKTQQKFFYCSCDPNKIQQICEYCALICHKSKGHIIQEQPPAKIKCSCGERAHMVLETVNSNTYLQKCTFHEFSLNSNLNIAFLSESDMPICLFCNNFCKIDKNVKFSKITVEDTTKIPQCSCQHQNHSDNREIFNRLDEIANDFFKFEFGLIKPIQFINLLFKSKETFKILYYDLNDELKNKIFNFDKEGVEIDKKIDMTNLYNSMRNFSHLGKIAKHKFFHSELLDHFNSIYNFSNYILDSKFFDDSSLWNFIYYFLHSYETFIFGNSTKAFPKFEIFDLENMNILLRILLMREATSSKDLLAEGNKIIDFISKLHDKINRLKFKKFEVYDILMKITTIYYKLVYFKLVDQKQIVVFLKELQKSFANFNEIRGRLKLKNVKKLYEKEILFYLKISKLLHLSVIVLNDKQILNNLEKNQSYIFKDINSEKINFIHDKSEVGRHISRINVKILIYILDMFKIDIKIVNVNLAKILKFSMQVLNYFANPVDSFTLGFKQLKLNKMNVKNYLQIMNSKFSEISNVNIESLGNSLNRLYYNYCNFNITSSKAIESSIEILKNFLDCFLPRDKINLDLISENKRNSSLIKINNFCISGDEGICDRDKKDNLTNYNSIKNNLHLHNDSVYSSHNMINNFDTAQAAFNSNYDNMELINKNNFDQIKLVFLIKSNFFFDIVKGLSILENSNENFKNFVNLVFKLFWYLLENNSDIAFVFFTKPVFNHLKSLPLEFSDKIFEIFLYCADLISTQNSEMTNTYHLIKKISKYLLNLQDDYKEKFICLNYFLKILEKLLKIRSLNYNQVISKTKEILKKIFEKFLIVSEFPNFLINLTDDIISGKIKNKSIEDYDQNKQDKIEKEKEFEAKIKFHLREKDKTISVTNPIAFNIFYLFLKLSNDVFDSSNVDDRIFLSSFIKREEIVSILKNKFLNLKIRSEILKIFSKTNIEILVNSTKSCKESYIKAFANISDIYEVNHLSTNSFPAEIYQFNQRIIKNSEHICSSMNIHNYSVANPNIDINFDETVYKILIFELKNFEEIISEAIRDKRWEVILYYFEYGMICPINIFLKKNYSKINYINGLEYLKIFEMIPFILNFKKFLIEKDFLGFIQKNKTNFVEINKRNEENELKPSGFRERNSILSYKALENSNREEIDRDLTKLGNKTFQIFNYTLSHLIIDTHFFSIFQKPKSMDFITAFTKTEEHEVTSFKKPEIGFRFEDENSSEKEKNFYRLSHLYKLTKGNLETESSSLAQNMFEISIEYESTYMYLILKFLIFLLTFGSNLVEHYSLSAYLILLKLLQFHTEATQDELEKIIELEGENVLQKFNFRRTTKHKSNIDILRSLTKKHLTHFSSSISHHEINKQERKNNPSSLILFSEDKSGFLINFLENLFYKLTQIFINEFNLENNFYNSTYLEAFNIIKILKFLCEEHNNFFQGQLLKKLNFCYNYQRKIYNINFFDMMVLILNNLLTISAWDKVRNDYYNIDYFYDLFDAVIELLIEIIQGNSVENLTNLVIVKSDCIYYLNKRKEDVSDTALEKNLMRENEDKINVNPKTPLQSLLETCNKCILFDDYLSDQVLYRIRMQLMNLFIALLEEKNCPQEVKDYVIESLPFNKIISSINNTLKKYFLNNTKEDKRYDNHKSKYLNKAKMKPKSTNTLNHELINSKIMKLINKDYKLLIFDDVMYEYFCDEYFVQGNGFPESPEFKFANTLYRFVKLTSIPPFSIEESTYLIKKVNDCDEKELLTEFKNKLDISNGTTDGALPNSSKKFSLIKEKENNLSSNLAENLFLIKFFEKLTQTVEVYEEDSGQISTVIFTVIPKINFLSRDTKTEFLDLVNRENQYTKLQYLVSNIDYFKEEIEYNSTRTKSKFFSFFINLNYSLIQVILFLLALATNFYIFLTMKGDNRRIYHYESGTIPQTNVTLTPWEDGSGINPLILYERDLLKNATVSNAIKYAGVYYGLTYLLIALCVLFTICYIVAKIPLYYEIELIRYLDKNKLKRSEISLMTKLYLIIYEAIIQRDHINSLLFMAISGTIAVAFPQGELEIFYSFMILTVVNLSPTLKNIVLSLRLKYKELLATLILTLIIIYVFSNIGFYFAQFRFNKYLDMHDDNYCESLLFCFLTHTNGALRIPGGIGDFVLVKVSYERTGGIYAGRLIYDFVWFCIINVTLLNIVFGIIIDTFKELRIEEQKKEHDRNEICFICGVNKDSLEKERKNFKDHVRDTHNLWNYVNYMISLKFSNIQDLNATNSYTLTSIIEKNIKWIPLFKNKNKKREKEVSMDEDNVNVDTDKYNEKHPNLKVKNKN